MVPTGPRRHIVELPEDESAALPTGAARDAVNELGARIANDTYLPGDVMPREDDLAASLGVSRATVRDAIKVLSGKGMVRTARRYGTTVRPVEDWNLTDADIINWHDMAHPRIARIFAETTELRSILEPQAAALAAMRATAAQVVALTEAAEAIRPGDAPLQTLFEADCRFHTTLLQATGNSVIAQMRRVFVAMLRVSYEYGIVRPDNDILSREGHLAVAAAIAARDPDKARAEMDRMLGRNRSLTAGDNITEPLPPSD